MQPAAENYKINDKIKFSTHEKKFGVYEIPSTKSFGPTNYTREKLLDSRNNHEKKI